MALGMADGASRWRHDVGDRVETGPVVADDTIYVSSSDVGWNPHHVRALDTSDGRERWRYELGSGAPPTTPTVVNDTVYVGVGRESSSVYALEQSSR